MTEWLEGSMEMKKRKHWVKNFKCIVLLWISVCSGIVFTACGEKNTDEDDQENDHALEKEWDEEGQKTDQAQEDTDESEEEIQAADDIAKQNEEKFYQAAEALEIDKTEALFYYERLCEDNVFQDGTGVLTSLWIEDLDGNGQKDMMVMVQEGEFNLYGEGSIYFYMNNDSVYRFRDDEYPFLYDLHVVTGDFDNDGNAEIAFESHGTGCGAAGDWYLRILKYKNHSFERMKLPSETYEEDSGEIYIEITQESQENMYSAYCPYLDDTIEFKAENIFEPGNPRVVGNNVRGYFDICSTDYEGREALVVSEYLCGEGGNVHCVGIAKLLILWEQDGSSRIEKWWIEAR